MEYFEKYLVKKNEIEALSREAKLFIMDNWQKVKDWSNLTVHVINGNNKNNSNKKNQEYYYSEEFKNRWAGNMKKIFSKYNSVKTVTDFVLDTIDYDMSVIINEKEWWWINDEAVFKIADYIKENKI